MDFGYKVRIFSSCRVNWLRYDSTSTNLDLLLWSKLCWAHHSRHFLDTGPNNLHCQPCDRILPVIYHHKSVTMQSCHRVGICSKTETHLKVGRTLNIHGIQLVGGQNLSLEAVSWMAGQNVWKFIIRLRFSFIQKKIFI